MPLSAGISEEEWLAGTSAQNSGRGGEVRAAQWEDEDEESTLEYLEWGTLSPGTSYHREKD